mmetsp:Transcript_18755/g.53790  ORF Transcript_18755/g.53790 Transcript_18755/m.53790 type:complete len:234 (-) Transcript_18755:6-707(-)
MPTSRNAMSASVSSMKPLPSVSSDVKAHVRNRCLRKGIFRNMSTGCRETSRMVHVDTPDAPPTEKISAPIGRKAHEKRADRPPMTVVLKARMTTLMKWTMLWPIMWLMLCSTLLCRIFFVRECSLLATYAPPGQAFAPTTSPSSDSSSPDTSTVPPPSPPPPPPALLPPSDRTTELPAAGLALRRVHDGLRRRVRYGGSDMKDGCRHLRRASDEAAARAGSNSTKASCMTRSF